MFNIWIVIYDSNVIYDEGFVIFGIYSLVGNYRCCFKVFRIEDRKVLCLDSIRGIFGELI